jgi:hypothetical protein
MLMVCHSGSFIGQGFSVRAETRSVSRFVIPALRQAQDKLRRESGLFCLDSGSRSARPE